MFSRLAVASVLALSFASAPALANIPKFAKVSEGIYRGGRPGVEGVEQLAAMGIKTIVNLDNDEESNREEELAASRLGIRTIRNPMHGWLMPNDREVDAAVAAINDPANHPVFVHCQYGQDRTGVVVAIHRIDNEGWGYLDALTEMKNRGFSKLQVLMMTYLAKRLGMELVDIEDLF